MSCNIGCEDRTSCGKRNKPLAADFREKSGDTQISGDPISIVAQGVSILAGGLSDNEDGERAVIVDSA